METSEVNEQKILEKKHKHLLPSYTSPVSVAQMILETHNKNNHTDS
jgi:hypothetical protein